MDARRLKTTNPSEGDDILIYADEKSSGTWGRTMNDGSWETSDITTEKADPGGHGSLSSNQITLAAGTYRVMAWAAAYRCNLHQIRIYDTTNSAVLVLGLNCYASENDWDSTPATLAGRFTLANSATIELQHRIETDGLSKAGRPASWGTEVYAQLVFWREKQ